MTAAGAAPARCALAGVLGFLACAGRWTEPTTLPPPPADRTAYFAFRARQPDLLEPNYVPFMTHRLPAAVAGHGGREAPADTLVFCRWDDAAMPLAVSIEPPHIPESLANEFDPTSPSAYVDVVADALASWERELGGAVRFRRVGPSFATLRIRLVGEVAPEPVPDVAVLGTTALGRACEPGPPVAWDPATGAATRLAVRFHVSEVRLYVADRFGLLTPAQVRRNALHEIGHALGMRGHSPVPADLMYEVARDRPGADALAAEDVNSFASLYRIPNGTVYAAPTPEPAAPRPPPAPPAGEPRLALSPHVDSRFGYALRVPEGWMRGETSQGMFAIDGVTWDYDASIQVIVRPYPSPEAYLARHGDTHVGDGRLRERRVLRVAGHPAIRLLVEGRVPDLAEEITVIAVDGARVLVAIADCPLASREAYAPWFEAALGSLRIDPPRAAEPTHPRDDP